MILYSNKYFHDKKVAHMEIYSTPIYGEALQQDTTKATNKNQTHSTYICVNMRKGSCIIPRIFHCMRTPDRTPHPQSRESLPLLFHHKYKISLEPYS